MEENFVISYLWLRSFTQGTISQQNLRTRHPTSFVLYSLRHSFNFLRVNISFYSFSIIIMNSCQHFISAWNNMAEGLASIKRIDEFLDSDECQSEMETEHIDSLYAVSLDKVSAKWTSSCEKDTLVKIDLAIEQKTLTAIVGKVGSGKTSLLQVILKELPVKEGILKVNGKISYACQEPWIFPSTIKQNILFINPMVKEKYDLWHKLLQYLYVINSFSDTRK